MNSSPSRTDRLLVRLGVYALGLGVGIAACQSTDQLSPDDATTSETATQQDGHASDAWRGDTGAGDVRIEDADDGLDASADVTETDSSEDVPLWPRELPCRRDLDVPDRKEPKYFTVPNDAVKHEPKTKKHLKRFLNNNPRFRSVRSSGFGPETQADRSGYNGYEQWVNDVTMYLTRLSRNDPPEDATFHFSILVDYQPVEFRYTRSSDDPHQETQIGTTTHLNFSLDNRFDRFEFVLPKEQFGNGRNRKGIYMISTLLRIHSASDKSYRDVITHRYALHYGATEWPDIPCLDNYPSSQWTDIEERLFRDPSHSGIMYIFPANTSNSYQIGDTVEVEREEKIPVNLSIHHMGGDAEPGGALVPFFGANTAHDMWIYKDGVPAEDADGRIAYRRQFVVRAPDEPGTYNLHVTYWPDAYVPSRTFWGKPFESVRMRSVSTAPGDASNVIPIRVR